MSYSRPHKEDREDAIAYLAEKYSKCFFVSPDQRRPLKKGIINDLEKEQDDLDHESLLHTLDWYQSHFAYQYATIAGAARLGLNGEKCGTVTPQEQEEARRYVEARKKQMRERQMTLPSPPVVKAPTAAAVAKTNGATMPAKTTPPALHPALKGLQSATGIAVNLMADEKYLALRQTLATAALREVIASAEKVIADLGDGIPDL